MTTAPLKYIKNDGRSALLPISPERMHIWKEYKRQFDTIWKADEVRNLAGSRTDFNALDKETQTFIEGVLGFFAEADEKVGFNIGSLIDEIPILEVKIALQFQIVMENIHSEAYSLQLDSVVENEEKATKLKQSALLMPSVKAISDWSAKWQNKTNPFARRIFAFACFEGILFASSFCAIYWLQRRGLMAAIAYYNELISRDEASHVRLQQMIYDLIIDKLTQEEVEVMVREVVALGKGFVKEILPINLIEMNATLMCLYVESVADNLVSLFGYTPIYGTKNPFPFMEQINLTNKTNFFERAVTEYQNVSDSSTINMSTLDNLDF